MEAVSAAHVADSDSLYAPDYFLLHSSHTSTASTSTSIDHLSSVFASAAPFYSTVLLSRTADKIARHAGVSNTTTNTSAATSFLRFGVETTTDAMATTLAAIAVASSSHGKFTTWSTSELVEMIYQMILFGVGTPVNVVALIKFSKSSRSSGSEMRLMRLSRQLMVAHLLVLCTYCVWRTHWMYTIHWTMGNILCKIYSFLSALPFHLWSNIVAAIAADMLYCIRMPLKSVHNGNKRVTWLIGISWLVAIICSTPMALLRGTVPIPETDFEQCYPRVDLFEMPLLVTYNVFHVVTTFYVPFFIVIFCYLAIGLTLRTQMAERKLLGDDKRRSSNINSRFLFGTICIVCTFVLTWLPYQVLALLQIICVPDSHCQMYIAKLGWLEAILIASTCINPFLYKFGIFRSSRRNASNGYYTYHSQAGAESNIATGKASTASGFRSDFRQSMRSLGPNSACNATMTASNGTLNSGTVSLRQTNGMSRLVSRLSANTIMVNLETDKQLIARRKYRTMYRSGAIVAFSADNPPTRCYSSIAAPWFSSSTQPLLMLSAKNSEEDYIPPVMQQNLSNKHQDSKGAEPHGQINLMSKCQSENQFANVGMPYFLQPA